MGDVSNVYRDAELNEIRNGTPFVGLFLTMPAANGTGGVEPTGGSYIRKAITFGAPADASPGRKITQSATVDFNEATADWGVLVGAGIWDAVAGNLLNFKLFTGSVTKTILTGQMARLLSGSYVITIP